MTSDDRCPTCRGVTAVRVTPIAEEPGCPTLYLEECLCLQCGDMLGGGLA